MSLPVGIPGNGSVSGGEGMITFSVPGKAAGKARPRVTRGGQHTYTPDPGGFVERVTAAGVEARNASDWRITGEPISMRVEVTRGLPRSWSRRRRAGFDGGWAPHTPDTGNIALACCDALSRVLFEDDNQVVELYSCQRWGTEPLTRITVEVLT